MLRDLRRIGFRGVLSLELFNREYWKQDAFQVAQTGLEKMCAVVCAQPLTWTRVDLGGTIDDLRPGLS